MSCLLGLWQLARIILRVVHCYTCRESHLSRICHFVCTGSIVILRLLTASISFLHFFFVDAQVRIYGASVADDLKCNFFLTTSADHFASFLTLMQLFSLLTSTTLELSAATTRKFLSSAHMTGHIAPALVLDLGTPP